MSLFFRSCQLVIHQGVEEALARDGRSIQVNRALEPVGFSSAWHWLPSLAGLSLLRRAHLQHRPTNAKPARVNKTWRNRKKPSISGYNPVGGLRDSARHGCHWPVGGLATHQFATDSFSSNCGEVWPALKSWFSLVLDQPAIFPYIDSFK